MKTKQSASVTKPVEAKACKCTTGCYCGSNCDCTEPCVCPTAG
jgi:hypothetical protein